mgnify:CR=1 FL=1
MLVKHRAIVLHSIPYGDNSKVLKCFTDNLGLQSYLVNAVNNKKGVLKPSMVMPLTQLSIVAYNKGKGGLERIKEARLESNYLNIPIDPIRNALAIFVSEILITQSVSVLVSETGIEFTVDNFPRIYCD